MNATKYTAQNPLNYNRFKTTTVHVGKIPMGSDFSVRVQSMTNTKTTDIEATIKQCIRIFKFGADYVRITAPTIKDVECIKQIRDLLHEKGFTKPLIVDTHFSSKVAEEAAKVVEKVRINPGNFIDAKKNFTFLDYSDDEYKAELTRLEAKFVSFLDICKQNNTAIRIGTNHGSLSDRIMSRYGDTPEGMVESVLEFLRICQKREFHDLVISLKSSNTRVMVHAYRLMCSKMLAEKMNYPLHLGVTEAGEGEDGRIKSAVGIGALMIDGIGDTIRVSLTEEPENEIPVAQSIVNYFKSKAKHKKIIPFENPLNPFSYERRKTKAVSNIGGENFPVVIADVSSYLKAKSFFENPKKRFCLPDFLFSTHDYDAEHQTILWYRDWKNAKNKNACFPLFDISDFMQTESCSERLNFVRITPKDLSAKTLDFLHRHKKNMVLVLESENLNFIAEIRAAIFNLIAEKILTPIIVRANYAEDDYDSLLIKSSSDLGVLFLDGLADGIWISNSGNVVEPTHEIAFGILQASRVRTTKPEYISCPGCGRTLFDLQEAAKKIREKTANLVGLKIGIMGCIVNGIGEMADADYGYVGSGVGKINLYKSKKLIKKNIPQENAVEELVALIKAKGDWKEK
ncbi:MAG: 4-hydroxy-3-methylbut-2-en-1-yl diphosphate synthase [Bacteroidia bacterium]|nr:MAG: 4-hydroxy-3-methylbut-2-en-1-yl diphosphate synthase [Bacteroidia bacterium]